MHRKQMAALLLALISSLIAQPCLAELRLPAVLSDGMVVQQKQPIRVWGWADPAAQVTVSLKGRKQRATADSQGRWSVKLPPLKAGGGPLEIQIESSKGDKAAIKDVLVGEVWVCSGQSNMEQGMTMIDNFQQEIAAADYPNIRLLLIPKKAAEAPQENVEASWRPCTPKNVAEGGWGGFSAVAYFFGRKLHKELNVPIGLIESAWGGTESEPWTSPDGMNGEPKLAHLLQQWEAKVSQNPQLKLSPQRPSVLYNAMIAPIVRLPIRGAIWYQGESNVPRAAEYRIVFPNMIQSWRRAWGDPHLPFYFVQIAPFKYTTGLKQWNVTDLALPLLWESQLYTLDHVDHTGMAVIHDVGNVNDIHPRNKLTVGERLANWALEETYDVEGITVSGPIYDDVRFKGDKIEIESFHEGSGLTTRDGKAPTHFEIAGEDHAFHPATVKINSDDTVLVWSDAVKKPKAVRFAWHEDAEPNLTNKEGLPASPFRTDDWPVTTQASP